MKKRGRQSNQVRIIGGEHRGRRLSFPDIPGLRPTGDRIRETLFNWLQSRLPGASCLDLFAGSGALGLEAASRGAGKVVMLDRSPQVIQQLRENIALLRLDKVQVEQADSMMWLDNRSQTFDIVFLDPPFSDNKLEEACLKLEDGAWLNPGSYIYIEMDASTKSPDLPSTWEIRKNMRAGQVDCFLCFRG